MPHFIHIGALQCLYLLLGQLKLFQKSTLLGVINAAHFKNCLFHHRKLLLLPVRFHQLKRRLHLNLYLLQTFIQPFQLAKLLETLHIQRLPLINNHDLDLSQLLIQSSHLLTQLVIFLAKFIIGLTVFCLQRLKFLYNLCVQIFTLCRLIF